MRNTLGVLAAISLAAVFGGCDLISEATSNQVMLAQLLQSPEQTVAGQTVPAGVVTNVFLGTRQSSTDTSPPTPTTGAKVHVEFGDGQSVDLPDQGDGNYRSTSVEYVPGDTYRFVAVVGSDTFAVSVTAPPSEHIDEFHPDGGFTVQNPFIPVSANADLTLHRAPANGEETIALTTIVPVSSTGPGQPSFDPPLDANTLLNVVLDPAQYEKPTVTVDGTKAWPACDPADYLVTVTGLKKGDAEGSNLFLGSTALAGSADGAPAHCQ